MHILPPPFTPLLTALISDQRLSAALFRSYTRLYAAAWIYAYQCTTALDFESQVVTLLGVSRSQAHQHLRMLRQTGLLDWRSDGEHRYIFRFTAPQLTIYPGPDQQPIRASLPAAAQLAAQTTPGAAPGKSPTQTASQQDPSYRQIPTTQANPGKDPGSPVSGYPGSGYPGSGYPGSGYPGSGYPGSGYPENGGVKINLSNQTSHQDRLTQQQPDSAKTSESISAAQSSPPDPHYRQALDCLRRAGVWSKTAERLAQQIAANEQAGDDDLPGIGDMLGWMVYCFAERESNQISNPAAVLAANLTNNRPCPPAYRPPLICTHCHRSQAHCRCKPNRANYTYPPEFLELALKNGKKYSTYTDRWGVCLYCHATPCQCE